MNTKLITKSIAKGIPYKSYRNLIKKLLANGTSTGLEQTDALFNYSLLNDKRMDRLDKTLKINNETIDYVQSLTKKLTFLVISEGWCGDAAQILPVLNKIAEIAPLIDLKIVLRDENNELMSHYLTNGGRAIPKILLVDENHYVINSWGPRPSFATKMVLDYKEKNGVLDDEFKKDLQIWYNKDKGNNTQHDIIKLLKAA